jgi:hypothetical protein
MTGLSQKTWRSGAHVAAFTVGRNAEPEDVAGVILVVAADASGFMPARGGGLIL